MGSSQTDSAPIPLTQHEAKSIQSDGISSSRQAAVNTQIGSATLSSRGMGSSQADSAPLPLTTCEAGIAQSDGTYISRQGAEDTVETQTQEAGSSTQDTGSRDSVF